MNDFVVRIDTENLNEKQAAAVAAAIQGAVLSELGKLDLANGTSAAGASAAGSRPFGSILFHPEWRGIWIRSLEDIRQMKEQVLTVQAR